MTTWAENTPNMGDQVWLMTASVTGKHVSEATYDDDI